MLKAWNHFMTINKHRYMVMVHCYKAGIFLQGCLHDLSKYSFSEFFVGAKYYSGKRSPNEAEREAYGHSKAWLHHKGRNKHHFEYWTDYNPTTKKIEPVEMPLRYVKEMFCDRVAASKTYLKDAYTEGQPLEYFLNGKERRSGNIHPETSKLLEQLLIMLAAKGEKTTFKYMRSLK
ncbi:DUF5662 family protein [Cellulosilyticum sp. ST5]|uniref:DUF5662 family protein n=1 Tax=Cellulosilyticum sp. ST5 TaxID=3055805 RepID=UPI003977D151